MEERFDRVSKAEKQKFILAGRDEKLVKDFEGSLQRWQEIDALKFHRTSNLALSTQRCEIQGR